MPVQMIRRDVEDGADLGMEGVNGLQLEAGNLRHRHRIRTGQGCRAGVGNADVAHHKHALVIILHDLAGEGCGGRLSVGAGDGRDPSSGKTGMPALPRPRWAGGLPAP